MAVALLEGTKIERVNKAFGEIVKEYIDNNEAGTAKRVLDALAGLGPQSKVRLFDILTKA